MNPNHNPANHCSCRERERERELILEDKKIKESLKVEREGLNLVTQKLYIVYEEIKANINLKNGIKQVLNLISF